MREEEEAPPLPLLLPGRGNCAGYHAARIVCRIGPLWLRCGRASARVGETQAGHRIPCAARARDLRRRHGSGWERSLPSGSGHDAEQ